MVCYGYSCLKEILLERSCVQIHGLRIKLKTDREQDAASLVPKKAMIFRPLYLSLMLRTCPLPRAASPTL